MKEHEKTHLKVIFFILIWRIIRKTCSWRYYMVLTTCAWLIDILMEFTTINNAFGQNPVWWALDLEAFQKFPNSKKLIWVGCSTVEHRHHFFFYPLQKQNKNGKALLADRQRCGYSLKNKSSDVKMSQMIFSIFFSIFQKLFYNFILKVSWRNFLLIFLDFEQSLIYDFEQAVKN